MVTIRSKTLLLCSCFLVAAWLLVAQTLNNIVVLAACLVCFLALVVWAAIKNTAMPVILFFLPFAPLLKLRPGTISFFTIALLLVYAVYTVTGSRQVKVLHLVPALLLLALTLVVKVAYGYDMDNTYILFAVTLMLVPFLTKELEGSYGFYWLTLCFALGICLAAVTAQYLTVFPTISRYIDVNTSLGMIRRSGYNGDPNFYSAHITCALGGALILFLNNKKKYSWIPMVLIALVLLYCGLMSVSKSFWLVSICMVLLWFVDLLFRRGKMSVKVTLIMILIVAILFVLSSTVFTDMLGEIIARFSKDNTISDLTTGRSELWKSYLNAFMQDPLLLVFGQGYSDVMVNGRPPHNTIIQGVFQFGLLGGLIMLAWLIFFVRTMIGESRISWNHASQLAIVMIGAFGPWMALDYLFFDEFFLMPIYVCAAIRFLHRQQQEASPLINEQSVVM